jgi:hypothetical protein
MFNRPLDNGAATLRILFVLVVVAAGVASALLPGSAAKASRADTAAAQTELGAFNCIATNSGHVTVPAGSTIVIRQGLGAPNPSGILTDFINAQTTTASVNDAQMADVSDQWEAPVQQPDGSFRVVVRVPTGVTLANPGDQMRFTFAIVVTHTVGGPPGKGSMFAPGLLFGGTCTVTAT